MRRDEFIKSSVGLLIFPGLLNSQNHRIYEGAFSEKATTEGTLDKLGGMSLPELLKFHREYLHNTYIPNWERGIDWEYGGFADSLMPGDEPDFEKKSMYYQARALWLFSYLYNHITHDERHLEAAIKGRDFLVKHALRDDFRWISIMSRDGKKLSEPVDHYGDIYMVQGLAELYRAKKGEKDMNLAINTSHSVMERLVSPIYMGIDAHGPGNEPGTRRLGSWQHFLGALTPLLRLKEDYSIEKLAGFCMRMIYDYHWLPEYGVLIELLDSNYKPFSKLSGGSRSVSGWHSIQASWMVMDEAKRLDDYVQYRQGIEMGISTLEKCYLHGKGIVSIKNPEDIVKDNYDFNPWNSLDDVLLFCLMVLEHNYNPVIIDYYNKCFDLYNSKPENITHKCLLHTPRRFFYSINILSRMIKNGGKVVGWHLNKSTK
jgi:mannose/cellobiose epimerase-like protein (N-acyl-D-glucosamine 2-epimerase family)